MAQRQFRSDDTSTWPNGFGNGTDGAYAPSTGTDAPTDSACSGTSGATSLTATNAGFAIGQLILIHQTQGTGVGQWELNKIANYSAGTITTAYPLIYTYGTGAQVLVMPQYSSGNIAGGVTITGKAWNGTVGGIYAKFCNGTFTIAGALSLTGVGFRGGSGVVSGNAYQGESEVGTGAQNYTANGEGGGGASHVGSVSVGGTAYQTVAGLTSHFVFGGGGGGGDTDSGSVGNGGAGGGLFLIIAKTITISGSIPLNGSNGTMGTGPRGPGGGGAGGTGLLKGQTITLGSNLVTSSAGLGATGGIGGHAGAGGGGSANGSNRVDDNNAGNGAVGALHADYLTSISGTTSPTIDTTQDGTLVDAGGGASFLYNLI